LVGLVPCNAVDDATTHVRAAPVMACLKRPSTRGKGAGRKMGKGKEGKRGGKSRSLSPPFRFSGYDHDQGTFIASVCLFASYKYSIHNRIYRITVDLTLYRTGVAIDWCFDHPTADAVDHACTLQGRRMLAVA